MMVPEFRCQQREQGNGKQHAGERDAAPQRQNGSQFLMTVVPPLLSIAVPRFLKMVPFGVRGGVRLNFMMAGRRLLRIGCPRRRPLNGSGKK
ncbi:hypothetical protein DSCA_45250 [Desulfosarcina alkanivorans]|uniref:Uncharacterized protein n=1 Tax=Desulfosarcina alkanivorans TaxID=571177 RepID=A0A5K7YQJ2_9BACT|nr:hypothetical protein DSCA_45250 [Desulfosarcina alkanivorans]